MTTPHQRARAVVEQCLPDGTGDQINHLRACITAALQDEREATIEECAYEVPTTWLHPLLSGDKAVIKNLPPSTADLERLLQAITANIRRRKDTV